MNKKGLEVNKILKRYEKIIYRDCMEAGVF